MNNKFLDKVIEQIISETRLIDNKLHTPFSSYPSLPHPFFQPPLPLHTLLSSLHLYSLPFYKHCRDVYGLNEEEVDYVWKEYGNIILDKINEQ